MSSFDNKKNISTEEQKKAINLGQKIAYFIAALPEQAGKKEDIAALIQEMSLGQMEKLGEIIDNIYAESSVAQLDEKFKDELLKIKNEYEEKVTKIDEDSLEELQKLEESLKK